MKTRRSNKLMAWLLTLAMLMTMVSGLTITASAEDTNPVVFTKELVPSTAGQPKRIKLEAYTTGSTTSSQTTMPADIILVLDQSGSMDDTIGSQTKLDIMKTAVTDFAAEVASFNTQNNDAYRLAIVGFASESGYDDNTEILTVYGTQTITNTVYTPVDITTLDTDNTYYIADGDGYTRISYYEASFGSYQAGWYTSGFFGFRDDYVNIQSTTVYVRTTTTSTAPVTTPGVAYADVTDDNYAAALVNCTTDTIASEGTIGQAIAQLDGNGATRTDLGMRMAEAIFDAQPAGTYENRQKIVVVITDGVPTTASDFSTTVANNAVTAAKEMKDGGAHIFSMYLGNPNANSVSFLQALSSNYPNATAYDSLGGDPAATSYYSSHTEASAITNVFSDIAFSITANSTLNERSVVTDQISEYFTLPVISGGEYNPEQIMVYTSDKLEGDNWAAEVPFSQATVTVESDKTVKVTGFNFAYHCVTDTPKVAGGSDYGRKLVIYIPIIEDENADTFGGYLPTNSDAGIYQSAYSDTPTITADSKYDNVTLNYSLLDAEHWKHIGTETTYDFNYDAATLNALLDEMIPADSRPNGSNNLGVSMQYSLIDTNLSSGNGNDDTVIATLNVAAGAEVDVTDFANWTLFDENNNKKTLTIPGGSNSAEAMYALACRLTNTNTPSDTLLEYALLDVEIVNESVHLVGGVIDTGGTLTVDPSAPGTLLENTYREAVTQGNASAAMVFKAKESEGYEIAQIIKRTSSSHDAPLDISTTLYDKANGINNVTFEADGSYIYQENPVMGGVVIAVYTRLKQFNLTTAHDSGSEIMDSTSYSYSTDPLEVYFAAHTGYKITSITVDGTTYTAEELLAKTQAELEGLGINLEMEPDHNSNPIIVDGDVHVSRTDHHTVSVTSAKRSYNLTYKYYQQTSSGYTPLSPDETDTKEFGDALTPPVHTPGDETIIGSDTYTLRGWYRTHTGTEFYGLTDLSAMTMPASDLVFHAFWEKNPDRDVTISGITKVILNSEGTQEAYGSEKTFNFRAVFNEQEVGTGSITVGASESTHTDSLTAVLTDLQYDQFTAASNPRPIYLYEVPGDDIVWIYDNTRYEIYHDGTIKKAGTTATEIVFTNRQAPYLVNYDLAGGNISGARTIAPEIVDYTDANLLPTEEPTKAGYTFAGWKKDTTDVDNTKTYAELAGGPTVTAITLVAQWTQKNYTVHYDLAGGKLDGSATVADNTVNWEDANLLPAGTLAKPSYTFSGWYKDTTEVDAAKTYAELAGADDVMEITLVAQWTYSGGGGGGGGTTRYTLTYESNGGTKYAKETYNRNTTVKIDKTPEKDGYVFEGWYEDKELTKSVDEVKMTKNITVYAKWVEDNGGADSGYDTPGSLNGEDHFAYVVGYPDGTVRPNDNISRAEATAIFFRLLKPDEVRDKNLTTENNFNDVNDGDWHNASISTMAKLGIVKGRYSDCFVPDAFITRAEFAAICARFDDSEFEVVDNFTDVQGHWAEHDIHEAAAHGWIRGYEDGTFKPDQFITRAEAMTMINRVLNRVPETADDLLADMINWPDNSDKSVWYYLAVQEATNSHDYEMKNHIYEKWTALREVTDWTKYK